MITSKFPRGQLLTPGRNQHFQNETEKQNLKTISCSRTNDFWFPPALHIMDNCKVYRHFPPSDCLSHTPKRILTNPPVKSSLSAPKFSLHSTCCLFPWPPPFANLVGIEKGWEDAGQGGWRESDRLTAPWQHRTCYEDTCTICVYAARSQDRYRKNFSR